MINDKSKTVTLPVWLISVIISILITGFTTWGIVSTKNATLETKTARVEEDIRNLQAEKVDRNEFKMVVDKLNSIENKLDRLSNR